MFLGKGTAHRCPRLIGVPIRLEPLTPDNDMEVRALRVASGQERFVATVEESLADAQPLPQAWLRAAYDGDVLVGFVMLWDSFEESSHMLWRLLVDARHQRRGHGRAIVEAVAEHVRAQGATALTVSAVEGDGGPRPFYESLGFVPTGEVIGDGEVVFALQLVPDELPSPPSATRSGPAVPVDVERGPGAAADVASSFSRQRR